MTTATRTRKPATKQPRSVRLIRSIEDGYGIVRITAGKCSSLYCVRPLDAEFGSGYRLIKEDVVDGAIEVQEVYDVRIDGRRSTCECKGFLRWGHCKHVSALEALVQSAKLAVPTVNREPGDEPVELDDL